MTPQPLLIVGAGGFGREVIAIIKAVNAVARRWELVGIADDNPGRDALDSLHRSGNNFLGPVFRAVRDNGPETRVIIAIGNPQIRAKIAKDLPSSTRYPTLIHPASTVGYGVELGPGCVIAAGARLSIDITLGPHVQIDQNVSIGHDVEIGGFSRLNPASCVSGGVSVGPLAYIGANATVLPRLHVGAGAIIGAGAVVTRSVLPDVTVKGVPAR